MLQVLIFGVLGLVVVAAFLAQRTRRRDYEAQEDELDL